MRLIIDTERDSKEDIEEVISLLQSKLQSRRSDTVVPYIQEEPVVEKTEQVESTEEEETPVEEEEPRAVEAPREHKKKKETAFTDPLEVLGKDIFGNDIEPHESTVKGRRVEEDEDDDPQIEIVKY